MRHLNSKVVLVVAAIATAVMPVAAQTPPAQKPSFEVTSIKPNRSGGPPRRIGTEGNRFIAENVPLILLIQMAYRSPAGALLREHVIGGPAWIRRILTGYMISVRNSVGRHCPGILTRQGRRSSPRFRNSLALDWNLPKVPSMFS